MSSWYYVIGIMLLFYCRFYLPHGLTVDHEDNLWLTDVASHQVSLYVKCLKINFDVTCDWLPSLWIHLDSPGSRLVKQ